MLCKLCQSKEAIQNSHIIPQFFSEWIKEGWPSGGLRNANEPNRRQQDTTKVPLLCSNCDNKFSIWETKFADGIFHPFSKDGVYSFAYEEWLLRFATSLSWRIGTILLPDLEECNRRMSDHLAKALTDWGGYLLGQRAEPPHEHHLFFDSLAHCPEFVGADYDRSYALWTIDCFVAASQDKVAIYAKLPGMTFFVGVVPPKLNGWQNTQILLYGVMTASEQEVTYQPFWQCMQDSARQVIVSMSSMSDKQQRKLQERHDANLSEWRSRKRRGSS